MPHTFFENVLNAAFRNASSSCDLTVGRTEIFLQEGSMCFFHFCDFNFSLNRTLLFEFH